MPLDGSTASSTHRPPGASAQEASGGTPAPDGSTTGSGSGGAGGGGTSRTPPGASGGATAQPSTVPPASSAPSTTALAASAAPARLTVSAPVRAASAVRWCEYVTVTFTNTGDKAATTGTVSTHIIGALGNDWATIDTEKPVPVPVKGGGKKKTWEICVDAWRVPLGRHIETQDVSLG
ncbi:hypothetical protein [Actinacidiphila soli]|uniref:hypothetical protein n=1 Tax=Actinacidiphila soli TaxID=2487275 RepID=UPI001F0BB6A8|nr:hypothetical protein [Actinacidiphila soli]